MKKMFFSVLLLCLLIFPTAYAARDTSVEIRLAQTASGRSDEYVTELSEGWRFSHYPQTDFFYDLCDENGIILWTEIPLVNHIGKDENFLETTKNQLSEMIRQQYNRPSICFWGIQNEVREQTPRSQYYTAKQVMTHLDALAHAEDSTGRYTVQAVNHDLVMDENDPSRLEDDNDIQGWKSDLIAWNIYPGWYTSFQGTIESLTEDKTSRDSRPMGLSEYGWGASVSQHELYPELGKRDLIPSGKWHPEEYQSLMHEEAVKYINTHDKLWATAMLQWVK